jgi:hypothetical protein
MIMFRSYSNLQISLYYLVLLNMIRLIEGQAQVTDNLTHLTYIRGHRLGTTHWYPDNFTVRENLQTHNNPHTRTPQIPHTSCRCCKELSFSTSLPPTAALFHNANCCYLVFVGWGLQPADNDVRRARGGGGGRHSTLSARTSKIMTSGRR